MFLTKTHIDKKNGLTELIHNMEYNYVYVSPAYECMSYTYVWAT